MVFGTKIVGYVVNVIDPLNFQIWLPIQGNTGHPGIERVQSGFFEYKDSMTNPPVTGKWYRCRLHNLRIKGKGLPLRNAMMEVMDRINRQNGWIVCNLIYIDKYDRLIVNLFDPVSFDNYFDLMLKHHQVIERYF